jgi:hypothetical protein
MANSTGGAWRQKSTGFLATIAAIVLVVVLAGGMALGYAIEKNRVKSDKTTNTTAKKKTSAKKPTAAPVRVDGTVDAITTTSMSVTSPKGAKQTVSITKTTQIVKVASGASSDIAAKTRVIFVLKGSYTTASAVIVLPGKSKLGDMVATADANTMSVGTAAKSLKITISGAKVEKSAPAKRTDIAKGTKVVVGAVRRGKTLVATEVVILPNDSPFA